MWPPDTVRGHLCDGLAKFQGRIDIHGEAQPSYECIPIFADDGTCVGCDAVNATPIEYCPFCGVKLA